MWNPSWYYFWFSLRGDRIVIRIVIIIITSELVWMCLSVSGAPVEEATPKRIKVSFEEQPDEDFAEEKEEEEEEERQVCLSHF